MATTTMTVAFATALLVLLAIAMRSEGQMPQQCTSVIMTLAPCLDYLGEQEPSPPQPCCSQLGNVVKSQPECLCAVLGGDAAGFGLNINKSRAMSMPEVCSIPTPPVSQCNGTAPMSGGWGPVSSAVWDKADAAANSKPSGSESSSTTPTTSGGVSYEPNLVAFFVFAGVYSFAL